jgi:Nucleotidyltransferase domain
MTNEKQLETTREFVGKLREAAGDNLTSVVLYGSAADGDFHPDYSDLNLLCVLRDASFASLQKLSPAVDWWHGKKHRPPLVLTQQELTTSADVFSIEFIDMKSRYRVLHGPDVLKELQVPMSLHRAQLEYEIREKLLLLRQHLIVAKSEEKQLWEVMLHSLSSFTTLFRHVLIELGEPGRKHSRDAVVELSRKLLFDDFAFLQLMDVRARKIDRSGLPVNQVAERYVEAIEKVAAAVDTMLSPAR